LSELDRAIAQFEEALAVDSTSAEPYIGIGAVQVTKRQSTEAEQMFLRATAVEPSSTRAQLALAHFYWASQQFDKTETALKAALSIDQANLTANRAMAAFLVATQRVAEAEPYFVALARHSPTSATIGILAQYYAIVGRKAEARKVLTELAARPDAYTDATVRLARMDLADSDRAGAALRLKDVLSRDARHVEALVLSATLLFDEGKYDQASRAIASALAVNPAYAPAHELAGRIHLVTDGPAPAIKSFEEALRSEPNSIRPVLYLSRLHLDTGSPDAALRYAEHARAIRPASVDARVLLARSYLAKRETARAQPLIAELQKGVPDVAAVHNLNAALNLATRRPDAARAAYEKASQLDPRDLEPVAGLVELDFQAARPADAATRVASLLAQRRDEPALLLAARTYVRAGRGRQAEGLILEAIGRNPNRLSNYGELGQLYARERRLDDAVEQFERMRQRDPKSLTASTMLGLIHERRGDVAAAEREYLRALSIEGRAVIAANNLAWLYVSSHRNLDKALEFAQVAHQQVPGDPQIEDTLGWTYVRRNLATTGLPFLESSAGKLPDDAAVQFHLGAAYAQTGNADKARTALTRALSLGLASEDADAARTLLRQLSPTKG
jgi:tetratricopeptide (TPR) repeat protein